MVSAWLDRDPFSQRNSNIVVGKMERVAELAGPFEVLPPVDFYCACGSSLLPNNSDKVYSLSFPDTNCEILKIKIWKFLPVYSIQQHFLQSYVIMFTEFKMKENMKEKMKEMLLEEERLWVPVAQGLPWSTDEPEVSIFTYSHSAIKSSHTRFW